MTTKTREHGELADGIERLVREYISTNSDRCAGGGETRACRKQRQVGTNREREGTTGDGDAIARGSASTD